MHDNSWKIEYLSLSHHRDLSLALCSHNNYLGRQQQNVVSDREGQMFD
jgi:hypothetical protein